jgi:hypothetical protein
VDVDVSFEIVKCIMRMGPKLLPEVLETMQETDEIRGELGYSLASWGSQARPAEAILLKELSKYSTPSVQDSFSYVLALLGNDTTQRLESVLGVFSSEWGPRQESLERLIASIPPPQPFRDKFATVFIDFLNSPDWRRRSFWTPLVLTSVARERPDLPQLLIRRIASVEWTDIAGMDLGIGCCLALLRLDEALPVGQLRPALKVDWSEQHGVFEAEVRFSIRMLFTPSSSMCATVSSYLADEDKTVCCNAIRLLTWL